MSELRRQKVKDILFKSDNPIKGIDLSKEFNVSRQVIVQDIAILRAEGCNIVATFNGYIIPNFKKNDGIIRTFESYHDSLEGMIEELEIILEYGGKILNVMIEHDVYGEITANLMISNSEDLSNFTDKMKKSKPLSLLTSGNHMHTIEIASEKIYNLLADELETKGYLVK